MNGASRAFLGRVSWFYLRVCVAALLIILLFASVGLGALVDCLRSVELRFVGIIAILSVLLILLGALNVWLILNAIHACPFGVFLRSYLSGWAAGLITPGQAGDASMVLFLKSAGVPFSRAAAAYLVDKVITLVYFIGIAWYGSCVLLPEFMESWRIITLGALFLGFCAYGAARFLPVRYWSHIPLWRSASTLVGELRRLRRRWTVLAVNVGITTVKWMVVTVSFHTAFLAFGAEPTWPAIGVIPILATLVGYIPASVAGIGTAEVTAVYLFGMVGIGKAVVLSSYLLLRCLQYSLASASMLLVLCTTGRECGHGAQSLTLRMRRPRRVQTSPKSPGP